VQSRSWFVHGPATVIVHPTYVDDVVEAVLATVEHEGLGGETINIGGAQALTYIELIDLVASTLGRPVHHVRMPAALRHAAALMGMVGILPARFERLTRPVVNRALDTSKASRLLGLHPLPLQEGLERTVAALRAQHLL
jgi:nucleoside-diphosphate-sugar epimerase